MDDNVDNYQCSDTERDMEALPNVAHTSNESILPPTPGAGDESIPQPSTSIAAEVDCDKNDQVSISPEHLDDEILTLLGDAPKEETAVGKNVHPDVSARLLHVLQNGLEKHQKDKIIEEYPTPGNCQLFKAPILNPEVKAAVSDILQKKDASLAARQGQLCVVLTALTNAIDILVSEKSDTNQTVLKHISNASRLLCDSHYIDTKLRRSFLISTLNNKLKDTLKESKRDKHLFGESLPENLKASKAITKSSQDLKSYVAKPKRPIKNNRPNNSTNNLNWKHPQPNTQYSNRKASSIAHRTAGTSSSAHRNQTTPRRTASSRAHRSSAYYKNPRGQ